MMEPGWLFTTAFLAIVCGGSMALVFYWAGTIENDIENNPGN